MAIDYTQFDTYKTTKSAYQDAISQADDLDHQQGMKNIFSAGTTAASLFSGAGVVGSVFGFLGGTFLGAAVEAMSPTSTNKNRQYSNIRQLNTGYYTSAAKAQSERNTLISNAQYYVQQTKSNFAQTYGKDSFNMLESTIATLLNMDSSTAGQKRMSELLGGLSRDSIIGDIETRLLNITQPVTDASGNYVYEETTEENDLKDALLARFTGTDNRTVKTQSMYGQMDRSTLNALNTKYLTISDLGTAYIQNLYESIVNSDSTYGATAEQLSKEQKFAAEQVEQSFKQTMMNNSQKFAELFLNMRSENISNAQGMGKSEAASGASGIKASQSSRTNNQVTKMNQDIARASYAILYDSYQKQVKADLSSGQLSREQVGYQYASQINSLKRQIKQSTENDINSWFHSATQYATQIGDYEEDTDTNMAAAKAGEEVLKNHGQEYKSAQMKYIYNTSTATV